MLLGVMMLSMTGMIIISPLIADVLRPVFDWVYNCLKIDPSIIPASLFANDMGGAPLSAEVAKSESVGLFNALIVSSMLGCTVSFTIPFALGVVDKKQHTELLLGLLCGIVTIPVGCFISGLVLGIDIAALVVNLIIPIVFSAFIGCGLILAPKLCVKIFALFGFFINALITVGLACGILCFLSKSMPEITENSPQISKILASILDGITNSPLMQKMATIEDGTAVCLNAAIVMSGAFPLISILSKVLSKPLRLMGKALSINEDSALGLFSSLATSVTTFGNMIKMDKKGVLLNSAFAVSGAFTLAGHLAFTLAYNADYLPAMIVGKLSAGILAVVVGMFLYKRNYEK
jgi:ethanolamine transporter